MPFRSSSLFLALSLTSWAVLLLSALSHTAALPGLGPWPGWATPLAQGVLAASVFLYARRRPVALHRQDFVGLLWQLVRGPGTLALACLGLGTLAHWAGQRYPAAAPAVFAGTYTLNLGLFLFFLAHVNYGWRALVYFKSSPRLRQLWELLEVALGLTLLFSLFDAPLPPVLNALLLVALGLAGVYLSSNQRWVAYLTTRQRWRAIGCQLALLGATLVFGQYFRLAGAAGAATPQHTFLLLTAFFAAFYSFMGLLVTVFSMPTAGVFEQRRAEVLSLQRLTQIIQRGQTAAEIHQTLLDSAVQTMQAGAAGLLLAPAPVPVGLGPDFSAQLVAPTFGLAPAPAQAIAAYLGQAGRTGREWLVPDLRRLDGWPAGLPFRSLAVLPLCGVKYHYGALFLLMEEARSFDDDDLAVLNTFTSQAVLSIENLQLAADSLANQRTQEELRIAAQVQDSLIPKNLPTDDWFDISTHSLAAKEMGGDFYDFLLLPGRRLAILIGDVSGKGVTAAFHMAQMKGIFHALMQQNPLAKNEREQFPLPSRFMSQANVALSHCLEPACFITAALYIIDYEQGGFMFARAGHCPTLYYHAMREEVTYFASKGLGLGILRDDDHRYDKHINNQFYDYGPGDVMVLYTDGIVEARDAAGNEFGEERLQALLERCYYLEAPEIKATIMADFNAFVAGCPVHDDQTMLVVKFKTAQPAPAS